MRRQSFHNSFLLFFYLFILFKTNLYRKIRYLFGARFIREREEKKKRKDEQNVNQTDSQAHDC